VSIPHFTLSNTTRLFIVIASLLGATGVAAGAYASHGLSTWADAGQVEYFQLAVTYQLFHSITLLVICLLTIFRNNRFLLISKVAFVLGIILFSGSLYLYVLTGSKLLTAATPIGGMLLIAGWLSVAVAMIKKN
jgi:uncharacterized membrane protein YgdD (TMEM256/DUF423 family)